MIFIWHGYNSGEYSFTKIYRWRYERNYTKKLSENRLGNQFKKELHNAYKNFVNKETNDQDFVEDIIKNFKDNEVSNGQVFKESPSEGLKIKDPYDLIIIDCPQYNFNLNLLNQLNVGGRIIYIEKIDEELAKAYKMIKYNDNYSKDFLFDVFSNFYLTKKEEGFIF